MLGKTDISRHTEIRTALPEFFFEQDLDSRPPKKSITIIYKVFTDDSFYASNRFLALSKYLSDLKAHRYKGRHSYKEFLKFCTENKPKDFRIAIEDDIRRNFFELKNKYIDCREVKNIREFLDHLYVLHYHCKVLNILSLKNLVYFTKHFVSVIRRFDKGFDDNEYNILVQCIQDKVDSLEKILVIGIDDQLKEVLETFSVMGIDLTVFLAGDKIPLKISRLDEKELAALRDENDVLEVEIFISDTEESPLSVGELNEHEKAMLNSENDVEVLILDESETSSKDVNKPQHLQAFNRPRLSIIAEEAGISAESIPTTTDTRGQLASVHDSSTTESFLNTVFLRNDSLHSTDHSLFVEKVKNELVKGSKQNDRVQFSSTATTPIECPKEESLSSEAELIIPDVQERVQNEDDYFLRFVSNEMESVFEDKSEERFEPAVCPDAPPRSSLHSEADDLSVQAREEFEAAEQARKEHEAFEWALYCQEKSQILSLLTQDQYQDMDLEEIRYFHYTSKQNEKTRFVFPDTPESVNTSKLHITPSPSEELDAAVERAKNYLASKKGTSPTHFSEAKVLSPVASSTDLATLMERARNVIDSLKSKEVPQTLLKATTSRSSSSSSSEQISAIYEARNERRRISAAKRTELFAKLQTEKEKTAKLLAAETSLTFSSSSSSFSSNEKINAIYDNRDKQRQLSTRNRIEFFKKVKRQRAEERERITEYANRTSTIESDENLNKTYTIENEEDENSNSDDILNRTYTIEKNLNRTYTIEKFLNRTYTIEEDENSNPDGILNEEDVATTSPPRLSTSERVAAILNARTEQRLLSMSKKAESYFNLKKERESLSPEKSSEELSDELSEQEISNKSSIDIFGNPESCYNRICRAWQKKLDEDEDLEKEKMPSLPAEIEEILNLVAEKEAITNHAAEKEDSLHSQLNSANPTSVIQDSLHSYLAQFNRVTPSEPVSNDSTASVISSIEIIAIDPSTPTVENLNCLGNLCLIHTSSESSCLIRLLRRPKPIEMTKCYEELSDHCDMLNSSESSSSEVLNR